METNISARRLEFRALNRRIRASAGDVTVRDCCGQRFIGSALKGKKLVVHGTPGNALGAYLNGGEIEVYGNAQDAVADTMNDGKIVIHGSAGDALGYAMRGGRVYVRGDAGYRMGIHMKAYRDKKPVIVVGGRVGSFLGEYLAGGMLVVLDLESSGLPVGSFAGTGMHGGKIFVRTDGELADLPAQVTASVATEDDLREVTPYIREFAEHFDLDLQGIVKRRYYVLRPNAKNPYKQRYVAN